jgi:iron complex outermembrane receptor protein
MSVLDERVQLTFGLRRQNVEVRRFNTTTGAMTASYDEAAVTPMVGILGKPLRNLSLYANYIEGLQEGSTAPTGTANQGEVLPPFVAKQYEVGAKWDIGRVAATLAAFQITQPSADTDPVTNIFEETGEQRHRGIELNVFGEVMTGVRLLGGATYIDAELTKTNDGTNEGNEPPGVSPLRVVFGAEWDTPFFQGFTLMGRVTHDSSNYLDAANTQKVPGWARLDLCARYRLERADGKPIVIRTTVTNVLDSDYWVNSSSQLGLSEPLTFRLSASFDF